MEWTTCRLFTVAAAAGWLAVQANATVEKTTKTVRRGNKAGSERCEGLVMIRPTARENPSPPWTDRISVWSERRRSRRTNVDPLERSIGLEDEQQACVDTSTPRVVLERTPGFNG
jgi:hypothetical protein